MLSQHRPCTRPEDVWLLATHTMGKGARGKSSATAATRKKHAVQAAVKRGEALPDAPPPPKPTGRGQKKMSKKERQLAKKRSYVPPPKPPQPPPYPLDSMGLAHLLPADLVVLLRKALKKDIVTRVRTLEGLLAWVEGRTSGEEGLEITAEERNDALVMMLACWVHLFPRLALSPSQRLRVLTLQIHASLLAHEPPSPDATSVRDELLSPMYIEAILGFWAVLTYDTSRLVARLGSQLWQSCITWDAQDDGTPCVAMSDYLSTVLDHLRQVLLTDTPSTALAQSTASLQTTSDATEVDAKSRDDTHVDESADELNGRLVAGGLGVLNWIVSTCDGLDPECLSEFVESPALWAALQPQQMLSGAALSTEPPIARQRAWILLGHLNRRYPALIDEHMDVIAPVALNAAWTERDANVIADMLGALLPLLRRRPDMWNVADDSDDEEEEQTAPFLGFVTWLQTIAPQAPRVCFPAVLVFLSTVPVDVLPPTPAAVSEFMSPLLALSQTFVQSTTDPLAWDAYVAMLCECLVFLVMRVVREGQDVGAVALLADELGAVWREWVLGIPAEDVDGVTAGETGLPLALRTKSAKELSLCLCRVDADVHGTWLLADLVPRMAADVRAADVHEMCGPVTVALSAAIDAARARTPPATRLATAMLELAADVIVRLCAGMDAAQLPALTAMLQTSLRDAVPRTNGAVARVAATLPQLGATAADVAAFYAAYVPGCGAAEIRAVYDALSTHLDAYVGVLVRVASFAAEHALPAPSAALQAQLRDAAAREPHAVLPLLGAPAALVDDATETALLAALAAQLPTSQGAPRTEAAEALATWHAAAPAARTERLCSDAALAPLAAALFLGAYVQQDAATHVMRALWGGLLRSASDTQVAVLVREAVAALQAQLLAGHASPQRVLDAARGLPSDAGIEPVLAVLPDAAQADAALLVAASGAPNVALSVYDPIVPVSSSGARAVQPSDLEPLVRTTGAYLAALAADQTLATAVAWILPHLAFVAMLLEDALVTNDCALGMVLVDGGGGDSASAWRSAAQQQLVRFVQATTRLMAALAAALPDAWHAQAASAQADDALSRVLASVWAQAAARDAPSAVQNARLLARLLSGVFSLSSVSAAEAERWVRAGMARADTPVAAAVLVATRTYAWETRTYDRWRNELAAALSGVPPSHANTDGVRCLHLLRCAAAPPDAGQPLVPTQRAVFVLQALRRWIVSDDDLDDAVFALLAALLAELAPVVQSVPGGHLDLMLDVVEENLQSVSLDEPAAWPTLFLTLRLLDTLYALESEHVRAAIAEHPSVADALHDALLAACAHAERAEAPSDVQTQCAELLVALAAAHVAPSRFAGADDQRTLVRLVGTPTASHALQVAAFRMYTAATLERVREQVVEASLGALSRGEAPELDAALVEQLARVPPLSPDTWEDASLAHRRAVFAFLLQWLAVLDHFSEASLPLRAMFAAALQARQLLSAQLLPSLFALIGGQPRRVAPLDASRVAIDDVALELLEPRSTLSLQTLAAHVYFRALLHVPTQVRDWWLSVRDRQLSLLVGHFTSKHCTPLLAARELSHLRDPVAMAHLQDEAMAVKVLSSNEVVATYTVDEHPMEIGVRLPNDFPLHGVEIRDLKRVGVSEAQWRAWLLAVQQMLSGKNGLIFDALMLFKKNAEAKFQGYEGAECAICYSIISPTDESLPTKPCRTCRHKFHGSCLYKWVSTSGASTCPLCRSIL